MTRFFTVLLMTLSLCVLSFSTTAHACKKNCKPSSSTQSATNQNSTTPAFAKSLKTISDRHYADKVLQNTFVRDNNTVVNRKVVNVSVDVQAIRDGKAKFINNEFHINGRIYSHHDGVLFPKSGNGFYPLNRIEYKTLGYIIS